MKIHSSIIGNGQDMVFLHGWGVNMNMMNPLVHRMCHSYRCINFDLFGFGESEAFEEYRDLDDYVGKLHEFLDSVEVKCPILIAHSFGARIAVLYANRYPTSALVLSGAAGLRPRLTLKKKVWQFLHAHHVQVKGSYDYEKATPFLKKLLVESVNRDLSEEMKKIQVPTLLIWGEEDKETPMWMAKKMNQLIKNSVLIVFKGGDHFAYYQESRRFCFIVKEFLENVQ